MDFNFIKVLLWPQQNELGTNLVSRKLVYVDNVKTFKLIHKKKNEIIRNVSAFWIEQKWKQYIVFDWSESKAQEGTESDKLLYKKKSHKLI